MYLDDKQLDSGALGSRILADPLVASSLAAKAALASPALTGTPTAPTAAAGTNTTQVATTAFVQTQIGPIWLGTQDFHTVVGGGTPAISGWANQNPAWGFDQNAVEIVGAIIYIPAGWSTVNVAAWWGIDFGTTVGVSDQGVVAVGLRAIPSGTNAETAMTFAANVTLTGNSSTNPNNFFYRTTIATGVSVSSATPHVLQFKRVATDAADTFLQDVLLGGLIIERAS